MRVSRAWPAALALAAGMAALPAWADDNGQVLAGKAVAQTWCANCHVVAPEQARGSDQAPSFASVAAGPDGTEARLRAFLAHPHGNMPDFKLAPAQIDDLAAYIRSLKH